MKDNIEIILKGIGRAGFICSAEGSMNNVMNPYVP